jgi:heme exporter protein A
MTDGSGQLLSLKINNLTRRFGHRSVLRDIDFKCGSGTSLCITGPNGSGKSTLLKIIAGLLAPSSGSITLSIDGKETTAEAKRRSIRLVSPEMNLYDELTGSENLLFLTSVSGVPASRAKIDGMLDSVGLSDRGGDFFGEYSSGMKQRLKLASALMSDPLLLLLDEPSSNLDDDGKELVYHVMEEQKSRGILVYATNERDEQRFGDKIVRLG